MKLFQWIFIMALTNLGSPVFGINFTKEYFGVGYSPYVKNYEKENGVEISPSWSTYGYNYILPQVRLLAEHFNFLVTFSMDTDESMIGRPWWENKPGSAFVMRAAAQVNKESKDKSTRIFVIQGVYQKAQKDIEQEEIKHAFEAAIEANNDFPGTVYGISFFNLFNLNDEDMEKLTKAYRQFKKQASAYGLAIGTRIHKCDDVLKNETRASYIKEVARKSDFAFCSIFPTPKEVHSGPEFTVDSIGRKFLASKEMLLKENPSLKIFNGETGWPSKGPSYNKGNKTSNTMNNTYGFWSGLNEWATFHKIPVALFEAFDEPWKSSPQKLDPTDPGGKYGAEGHYGWWRLRDNTDPNSLYEKYLEPSEYEPIKVEVSNVTSKDDPFPKMPTYNDYKTSLSPTSIFTLLGTSALVFLMLVQVMANLYSKLRVQKKKSSGLTQKEIEEFIKGALQKPTGNDQEHAEEAVRLPYNKQYEISKEKLNIDSGNVLGSGNFGIVYKGSVTGLSDEVAFKTIRNEHLSALRGMLAEIKIMSYVGIHDNIVQFIGAYTAEISKGIVYVAVEYCPFGSLESYLRDNGNKINKPSQCEVPADGGHESGKEFGFKMLCRWAFEIAKGMEYLSSKKVIHADLATRNVLLSADKTAKITDFGLSRRMYEYTEYVKSTQESLPWRWMAIESLKQMVFSSQSDVWAFGITLWELFAIGDVPYPGLSWDVNFLLKLEEGMRLTAPKYATPEIYEKMYQCWNIDPRQRPSFIELVNFMGNIQDQSYTICKA